MKLKSKTKRLLGTFALATTFVAAAAGGLMRISNDTQTPVASASTTTETTYFSGIRSSTANTLYLYWQLNGEDLGSPSATGVAVDWYGEGDTTPETKYLKLSYTTVSAQNKNNLGSTILRADAVYTRSDGETVIFDDTALKTKAPAIKIDWFSNAECTTTFAAEAGDTFTVKSGTAFASETVSYQLNQDYTFSFNGAANGWSLSEDTHIPVGFTGARSGSATEIYAYGPKLFDNYIYASNTVYNEKNSQGYTVLNNSVEYDYYASDDATATPVTGEIQYQLLDAENSTFQPCVRIVLNTTAAVGGRVVFKKGTVFDNYVLDRDYTFTQVATTGRWYMTAESLESDPTMTLTSRANNLKDGTGINFFTTSELPFGADERFAKWTPIDVSGTTTYINYMGGLGKSGDNYSFYIKFHAKVAEGSIVTLPKGMYIAGYRLANTHYFKYTDSTSGWSLVQCDNVNHVYDDAFTCHDRECACGHVEKATTEHAFADGTYVCNDRVCTTCGDTVLGVGHTIPNGSYECSGYTCSVCNAEIAADESKHVATGVGCASSCENCGVVFATHEYPEMPEGGWVKGNELLTVTEEPDCTNTGKGTIACVNCSESTTEVVVNALGHSVPDGEKYCEREGCNYRIPYTADDMEEILELDSLTKYTYSDASVANEKSTFGQFIRAEEGGYNNDFNINIYEDEEKKDHYVTGKENTHDMLVSFSLNITSWAGDSRSHFVYLNSHENGAWGIGFQFILREGTRSLRVNYRPNDNHNDGINFVTPVNFDKSKFTLNTEQKFTLGAVQNDDGSYFVFAYWNGELFLSGTLTNTLLTQNADETTHNGLGGGISFRFNGSQGGGLSVTGSICDLEHSVEGTQYACKEYDCKVCSATIAATEEHSWGNGVSNGNGSCTVKEQFTRTCATCGDTTTYDGDYVHTWDTENPTIVTPAACNNVDRVERYGCKHCEAVSEDTTIADTGIDGAHDFANNYHDVTPATCIAGGTEQSTCEKCGALSEISDTPINKNAHNYGTEIAEDPATCTENGTAAHYQCALCNKLFTEENGVYTEVTAEDLVIAATHNYGTEIAEDPATCTENGTAAHYACSACGKLFTKENDVYTEVTADDLVITAGHSYVFVAAVAATAEADGMAEHYACSACGKLFTKEGDVYTETTEDALKVEYVAPETPVDDNDDKKDDKDEKGCGSSISAIGLVSLLTVCGAAFAVARRKED